jgi:hypothetical protein
VTIKFVFEVKFLDLGEDDGDNHLTVEADEVDVARLRRVGLARAAVVEKATESRKSFFFSEKISRKLIFFITTLACAVM